MVQQKALTEAAFVLAILAVSAWAQIGAAIAVAAVLVIPAIPARAQMEVVILAYVHAVAHEVPQPADTLRERYECNRCHDRLLSSAFGIHQNGRGHVRCLACNINSICKPFNMKLKGAVGTGRSQSTTSA